MAKNKNAEPHFKFLCSYKRYGVYMISGLKFKWSLPTLQIATFLNIADGINHAQPCNILSMIKSHVRKMDD